MSVYTENGYTNRTEYLRSLSEDYGVDMETVMTLANLLGPEEDFDGLVCQLEEAYFGW